MNLFNFFKKKKKESKPKNKTLTNIKELGVKAPFVFVVFDTETNGLSKKDGVLSVSAEKWFYNGIHFSKLDTFERFYFPKWFLNKEAVAVHGLTRKVLREKRKGQKWPRNWYKDVLDFYKYFEGVDLIVGHNSGFDRRFYSFMNDRKVFCTMYSNMRKVGALNKVGKLKQPKLMETAKFYNIPIEENKLHGSSYDVELTAKIFMKMLEEESSIIF